MISIEMITKEDDKINKTIEEILSMRFSDFEIIIVDSSIKNRFKDYENINCIKYIHDINLNFLSARLKANKAAIGDYVLLLDSTRIINEDILKECMKLSEKNDMVIIPEVNKSKSNILNAKSKAKFDTNHILSNCNPINGIFLPRFYKKKLIDEGWGLSIVESSASGTPTIAFNVPGLVDTIENSYNGFLVNDINEFTDKILYIIRNEDIFIKNSRIFAEKFTWERTADMWRRLLNDEISH